MRINVQCGVCERVCAPLHTFLIFLFFDTKASSHTRSYVCVVL